MAYHGAQSEAVEQTWRNAASAFRFIVEVGDEFSGLFCECTLPNVEWEVEEVKEGGLNTYTHQLPGQRKSSGRITLKNGLFKGPLAYIAEWFTDAMKETYVRKTVTVKLLGGDSGALMTWHMENVIPVKWSAPQFKTDSNAAAINSLELAYGQMTIEYE